MKHNITNEMLRAAADVLAARKEVESVAPVVLAYQRQALRESVYRYSAELMPEKAGERILEPEDAWLMDDAAAQRYFARLDDLKAEAGFNLKPGYCPLLMAKHQLVLAENKLIEAAYDLLRLHSWQLIGDKRRKAVDLLLKACELAEKEMQQLTNLAEELRRV